MGGLIDGIGYRFILFDNKIGWLDKIGMIGTMGNE